MNNNLGQVAGHKALITVVNFTEASNSLVQKELNLITKGVTNLALFYCTLNPYTKTKSIIYRALKSIFRLTSDQYEKNKEDTEDIVSEALFLLRSASIKYFEKDRNCNFEQFAVTHIKEGIKGYRSKWNGFNGSDRNELIHSAIRAIKKQNCQSSGRLTYSEAKHLAAHFNLCSQNGHKIIWDLENIHFEKQSEWKIINSEKETNDFIHVSENIELSGDVPILGSCLSKFIKSYHNTPENISSGEIFKIEEERNNNIKIIKKFQDLYLDNKIKKLIFEKRMYCEKENEIKLKDLSKLLNISIQRISLIEKNLRNEFKKYFNVEKNKTEDIK